MKVLRHSTAPLALVVCFGCARNAPPSVPCAPSSADSLAASQTHKISSGPSNESSDVLVDKRVADVLRGVRNRYAAGTLRVRVAEVWAARDLAPYEAVTKGTIRKGVLEFRGPNQYAFRFDNGDYAVSDGHRVIEYYKAQQVAVGRPAKSALYDILRVFLFGSPGELFSLKIGDAGEDAATRLVARAVDHSDFKAITIRVAPGTYDILTLLIRTPESNRLALKFEEWEFDVALDTASFDTEVPTGTRWAP